MTDASWIGMERATAGVANTLVLGACARADRADRATTRSGPTRRAKE
jgi:hypothetical protein